MASFNHIFFFIFLLCVLTSLNLAKCDLAHKECNRVHEQFASLDVDRCIKMLSADPKAFKATNLKDLTVIALGLAEKSAKQILLRVNATLASGKLSPELKPVITEVARHFKMVYLDFATARLEVKEDNEYMDANYDVSVISDHIRGAQEELSKVKGKYDPTFYQQSFDLLSAFSQIGMVLTNDGQLGGVA